MAAIEQALSAGRAVRLQYVAGSSDKFWEVQVKGSTYKASWGRRSGRAPQSGAWKQSSKSAAVTKAMKKVREKLNKGYKRV